MLAVLNGAAGAAQGAVGLSSHSSHRALGTQGCAAAAMSQSRVVPVPSLLPAGLPWEPEPVWGCVWCCWGAAPSGEAQLCRLCPGQAQSTHHSQGAFSCPKELRLNPCPTSLLRVSTLEQTPNHPWGCFGQTPARSAPMTQHPHSWGMWIRARADPGV